MTSSQSGIYRAFTLTLMVLVAVSLVAGCTSPEPEPAPAPATESAPPAAPAEKAPPPPPTKETACDDGKDEDADGKTDCKDSDCAPSDVCQIAHCEEVCATIMKCDTIIDSCSEKELEGILAGCQGSCTTEPKTRSQLTAADGVPCFIIGGVFLEQVQSNGLCGGDKPADDA